MERSIETIWREGFLDEKLLVAPKVNDIYDRKSKMIVGRLKRMFSANLIFLVGAAIALVIVFPLIDLPIIGISLAVMLIGLVIPGRRYLKDINALDITKDSYHYLLEFQKWRLRKIAAYTKIYKIFYPVFFLVVMTEVYFNEMVQDLMIQSKAGNPDLMTLFMVPYPAVIGIAIITGILYLAGGALYRFDLKIVYGREFARLDETLEDMKTLRD